MIGFVNQVNKRIPMRTMKSLGAALAVVGVIALSACGNSTASLLKSTSTKTKNAALDDDSGLNVRSYTFDRQSLSGWQSSDWGVGLEDQIIQDDSKYTPCENGVTSVPNIDSEALQTIINGCAPEFLLVHYSGFVTAPGNKGEEVSVKFRVAKDDTFAMMIGDQKVINAWNNTGCEWVEGTVNMEAGKKYPLDAWFSQFRGGICNQMAWSVNGGPEEIVPSSALSRSGDKVSDAQLLSAIETSREIIGIQGNVRGVATDGKKLYVRTSFYPNNLIYETGFDGQNTVEHIITNAPTDVNDAQANLAMSHGCIWTSSHSGNLYCTDTATWTAAKINVPSDKPLPAGVWWMYSNMTDFPDGRIARISAPRNVGGVWQSILRVYNVSGTGTSATVTFDRDWVLTDTEGNWPNDDHGIATDGRFLYRIRYAQGYKVWDLSAGSTVPVYFNGNGQGACGKSGTMCSINPPGIGNATYIAHDHVNSRFLVGDYDGQRYYYTRQGTVVVPPTTTTIATTTTVEATTTTEATGNQQAAATTAAPTTVAPATLPPTTTLPAGEVSVNVVRSAAIPLTSIIKPAKGAKKLKWSVTSTCAISGSNLIAPATTTTCKVRLTQTVTKKVDGKNKAVRYTKAATVVVM